MVSWFRDGYMFIPARRRMVVWGETPQRWADAAIYDQTGSYNPVSGTDTSTAARFATGGSVDAQIITRVQYTPPHNQGVGQDNWYLGGDNLLTTQRMNFVTADFTAHPGLGMTVIAFVAPASAFVDGDGDEYVPTPSQIRWHPDATYHFDPYYQAGGAPVTSPSTENFFQQLIPVEDLDPNTKYWIALVPSAVPTTYSGSRGTPLTPMNKVSRAVSVWTNRTPLAPTITSPATGRVVSPGTDVTFSFRPRDPDALPDAPGDQRSWSFADLSGVQVQYSARPTAANPSPTWIDMPIATVPLPWTDDEPELDRGWFIEAADGGPPAYVHLPDDPTGVGPVGYTLPTDGAEFLRNNRTMKIRCGNPNVEAGYGMLPVGQWRLRMRTFDYGHAMSTLEWFDETDPLVPPVARAGYGPLGTLSHGPEWEDSGPWPDTDYTPDTFPAINTSPWSETIQISVTPQVPEPIPLYPTGNLAVPDGTEVTLRWKYRNTYVPPFAQREREVQIRKAGELSWTTLARGLNGDQFYDLDDPEPNEVPPDPPTPPVEPDEYVSDGGFEAGITGWLTTSANGLSQSPEGSGHESAYALVLDEVTMLAPLVYRFYDLDVDHEFLTLKAWGKRGVDTELQIAVLRFWDADDDPLTFTLQQFPVEAGWQQVVLADMPVPAGAVKFSIELTCASNTSHYLDDMFDDISVLGNVAAPVEPGEPEEYFPPLLTPEVTATTYTLEVGNQYEWRVRVADAGYVASEWSSTARFWVVPAPVSGNVNPVPVNTIDGATLGNGTYRVEVFRRGGTERVGVLDQVSYVDWARLRDEISDAKIVVSGWDLDQGNLLSQLQTWAYEIVIFRDNGYSVDRVWEGPITLLTYEVDKVTINAKDVMAYAYRRIVKQAFNDSHSGVVEDGGPSTEGDTVTNRAARILQSVFASDDPNILQYLTLLADSDDAVQYRNLPPYSRTAYEEIDDMASNSGLDYVAVGRAILLWGTKRRIGTLPEFRDKDLGSSPIVSEYGMSMANVYSVSDGNGVHGEAYRLEGWDESDMDFEYMEEFGEDPVYGRVEMLSSTWASDSEEESGTYTEEGLATITASFRRYAEKSISSRYPPPVVVRVPDNTTLNPSTLLSIQQLIPGVAIPLRSTGTLREVTAIQKLDSVKVVEVDSKETITITLSPLNREDTTTDEEL